MRSTMSETPEHVTWSAMKPKIEAAFARLEEAGITAKMNFSISISNGISEIYDPRFRGYAFWHEQDEVRVRTEGVVMLAFGVFAKRPTDDAIVALGREVRAALEEQGLFVDWDDSADSRIEVRLFAPAEAPTEHVDESPPAEPAIPTGFVVGNEFREVSLDGSPTDIDLSNDGKYLAVAIHKGKPCVRIFATEDGACIAELGHDAWSAFGVAFVEGGRSLCYLTWTDGQKATLWKTAVPSGTPEKLADLTSERRCKLLARDAEGSTLAVGGAEVLVLDVKTASERFRLACKVTGAEGIAHFADQNRLWVFGSESAQLVLHDIASGDPLKKLAGPSASGLQLTGSPDGRWLVGVGGGGRGVALYDLATDKRIVSDVDKDGFDLDDDFEGPGAFAFSHDSTLVLYPTRFVASMTLPGLKLAMSDASRDDVSGDHAVCAATALDAPLTAFAFHRSNKVILVPTQGNLPTA